MSAETAVLQSTHYTLSITTIDVNETFSFETETRPRLDLSRPRPRRFQDVANG